MIHWGELGRAAFDFGSERTADTVPQITPHEDRLFYGAKPQARSVYRRNAPSLLSVEDHFARNIDGRISPSSPLLQAPMLANDSKHVLSQWFGRQNPTAQRNQVRRRFFQDDPYSSDESSQDMLTEMKATTPPFSTPNNKPTKNSNPVEVAEIDLNIATNTAAHHTDSFEITQRHKTPHLVVRRGQSFDVRVTFRRVLDFNADVITVVFETGNFPRESQGTRIRLPLHSDDNKPADTRQWWAQLLSINGTEAIIRVNIAVQAIVGVWNMKVFSGLKPKRPQDPLAASDTFEFIFPVFGIYILFNPWCSDDLVYMPDEEDRQEYVLNDVGKMWRGTHNFPRATSWVYGQFDDFVLKGSITVLEKSKLPYPNRACPIQVARTVAGMINAPDECAVLCGNWTGEYRNGTPPTQWTGSIEIMKEYYQLDRPVSFGQCWVFAGVMTSVLRTLGIPCRPVTVYSAVRDTESSVTANLHMDRDAKSLRELNSDAIWNYHVWNECWMARLDLGREHNGWQVIDSTPQEKNDGLVRAGPASRLSIKEGDLGLSYDAASFFAELNADRCYWIFSGDRATYIDRKLCSSIVTKKPGPKLASQNVDCLNITDQYKKGDTLQVPLQSFTNQLAQANGKILTTGDVSFDIDMHDTIQIGRDFKVTMRLKNSSKTETRTISVSLRAETVLYTGRITRKVKADKSTVILPPSSESKAVMRVTTREYLSKLLDQSAFLITTVAQVLETGQLFVTSEDFRVLMPEINIQFDGAAHVNKKFTVTLSFANPLPMQLTNCRFIVDSPGITEPAYIACKCVLPMQQVKATAQLIAHKSGCRTLVARFTSDQLQDIDGCATLVVID